MTAAATTLGPSRPSSPLPRTASPSCVAPSRRRRPGRGPRALQQRPLGAFRGRKRGGREIQSREEQGDGLKQQRSRSLESLFRVLSCSVGPLNARASAFCDKSACVRSLSDVQRAVPSTRRVRNSLKKKVKPKTNRQKKIERNEDGLSSHKILSSSSSLSVLPLRRSALAVPSVPRFAGERQQVALDSTRTRSRALISLL